MRNLPLVHFVDWKKLSEAQQTALLAELPSWGVENIVVHPVWGLRNLDDPGYLAGILKQIRQAGLKTPACHGFWGGAYGLACPDDGDRSEMMKRHGDFILRLQEFGVRTYALHLSIVSGQNRREAWRQIRKSIDELLPAAEKAKIILALENLHESWLDLEKLNDLLELYRSPFLGVCFDTGHARCYLPEGIMMSLELMKNHIVTSHMHDNYGHFDDHNPPGQGVIDWKKLISALKRCPRLCHAETEAGDWGRESWNRFAELWRSVE